METDTSMRRNWRNPSLYISLYIYLYICICIYQWLPDSYIRCNDACISIVLRLSGIYTGRCGCRMVCTPIAMRLYAVSSDSDSTWRPHHVSIKLRASTGSLGQAMDKHGREGDVRHDGSIDELWSVYVLGQLMATCITPVYGKNPTWLADYNTIIRSDDSACCCSYLISSPWQSVAS